MRFVTKHDVLIIAKNSGILMIGIGVMYLIPVIVDLLYLEFNAAYFLIPALISIISGLICMYFLGEYSPNRTRLNME